MFQLYILPVVAILSLGTFGAELLRKRKFFEFTFYEWFAESWLIGSFFLIVPLVLASLLFEGRLYHIAYGYYALSLLVLLYYILYVTVKIRPSQIIKQDTITKKTDYKVYSIILTFLILGYTLIALIYPERGWDALQFYFPNSIYFFLADDIPNSVNPFTFYPTAKPPSNTLFLTYSLYATQGFYAHLIPVFFVLGISCATVIFAMDLGLSKRLGLISSVFLLTTPAINVTITQYSFYQELPVTFFFSMAIIYYQRGHKTGNFSDYFLSSMAASLAVLSKLSGFTVIVVLLIAFPIVKTNTHRIGRYWILIPLSMFLARKASYDIYLGTGIAILLIALFIGFQLEYAANNEIPSYSFPSAKKIGLGLILLAYLASITVWIKHMLSFPSTIDLLRDQYFERNNNSIAWHFNSSKLVSEIYLENAHSASFITSILGIFIASQFGLFLALPKIMGTWKSYKKYPTINLWMGTFYIIWLAFHSTVSIRYLSIIWIPLSISIVIGIEWIIEYFEVKPWSNQIYLSLILTNFLFYFSYIPFEFVSMSYHERLLAYHTSLLRLLLYFTIFWLVVYLILMKLKNYKLPDPNDDTHNYSIQIRRQKMFVIFLSMIIVITPVAKPFGVLVSTGFDIDEFQTIMVYDNRETVKELTDFMNELNFGVSRVTIVVNIPGLGYWLNRPVIDLLFASQYLETNQSTILSEANTTKVFSDLKENDIDYVVKLLENHVFYQTYTEKFESLYPFLKALNSTFGENIYTNNEFELWAL